MMNSGKVVFNVGFSGTNWQEVIPHEDELSTELGNIIVGNSKKFFFRIDGLQIEQNESIRVYIYIPFHYSVEKLLMNPISKFIQLRNDEITAICLFLRLW